MVKFLESYLGKRAFVYAADERNKRPDREIER